MIRTFELPRSPLSRAFSAARYACGLAVALAACASETNDAASDAEVGAAANASGGGGAAGAASPGGGVATGGSGAKAGAGGSSSSGGGSSGGTSASSGGAGGTGTSGSATAGSSSGGNHAAGNASGGTNAAGSAAAGTNAGGSAAAGTSAGGSASGGGGAGMAGAIQGGSGNAPCDGAAVFCDDFEDGNSTGWTKSGGTWAIVDDAGDGVYQGGNGSEESYAGDTAWTDQTVEANVKVTSFGGTSDSYRAGIIARRNGSSNFYAFAIGGDGNLTLRKSTSAPSGSSGTCGAIASGIDATKWFTLKMSVSGAAGSVKIKTYLNGVLKHDCTTTSSTVASGSAGVLTYGSSTVARFDDVSVTTP